MPRTLPPHLERGAEQMIRRLRSWVSIAVMCASAVAASSRGAASDKPSIMLFVFDTTRADAVSAYGRVQRTTPELDRLATAGLRYTAAHSNAPWTLPSHATLFTGLLPSQHGVGSRGLRASDELVMLAERLRAAGYETVSFSENPFLTESFNMTQGFERSGYDREESTDGQNPDANQSKVTRFVAEWLHTRNPQRPFFLFINVMDAHEPYAVRAENPFVPAGGDVNVMRAVAQNVRQRICSQVPSASEIAVLRGLYLGGVAVADAKLRSVRDALRAAGVGDHLVTVVTSDHGEHFGEHRLMEHNFSVYEALLHVPLVVAGAPGARPGVIDGPVQLADIVPTVLRWAGLEVPNDLPGRPLPTENGPAEGLRSLIAEFTEPDEIPQSDSDPDWIKAARQQVDEVRRACGAQDRVFGNMLAVVRYPFELIWFERYPEQLYDVVGDPDEQRDLASTRPDVVRALDATVQQARAQMGGRGSAAPAAQVPPAVQEHLRALGYLPGATAASATPTSVAQPPK